MVPPPEDARDDHKEAEKQQLDKQPADDEVLAHFDFILVAFGRAEDAAAAALHEEAEDVAGDEELGGPGGADQRVPRAVGEGGDYPAEDHVDGGGVEGGGEQEEEGLAYVGAEGVWVAGGDGAEDVAEDLDWRAVC